MKCLCSFRAREHCSAFIPPFLLMKQNRSDDGEENSGNHSGPDQAPAKWRLARHPPVILICPAFTRTHGETNPLLSWGPPRVYLTLSHYCGQTGSQQRGPVASQTPTFLCRCRLCVHGCRRAAQKIMQRLCSLVGIFCPCSLSPCVVFTSFVNVGADEATWKSRVEPRPFLFYIYISGSPADKLQCNKATQNFASLFGAHFFFSYQSIVSAIFF